MRSRSTLLVALLMLSILTACAPAAAPAPAPVQAPASNADAATTAPGAQAPAESKVKAAVLLEGPLADTGWNSSSWAALQELGEKYGWDVAYTDNVKTEDMPDLLRSYAQKGYSYLFAPGWLWGDPMVQVSQEFPKTHFVHVTLNTTAGENFSSNAWVYGEMAYFAGRVAGAMTKTGKIGWVGGTESPVMTYDTTVYEKAAKEENPDVTLTVSYVGSWTDMAKAKELSLAMIESGVDVILSDGGAADLGVMDAVKQAKKEGKDVQFIGWTGDQCQAVPDQTLASVVQLPGDLIRLAGEAAASGKLMSGHESYGMKEGSQRLAWCGENVPAEIRQKIDQLIQDYLQGKIDVPHRTDI